MLSKIMEPRYVSAFKKSLARTEIYCSFGTFLEPFSTEIEIDRNSSEIRKNETTKGISTKKNLFDNKFFEFT